jgi:hypothetical protein
MPFGASGGIIAMGLIASAIGETAMFREDSGTTLRILLFMGLAAPPYLMVIAPLLGIPTHLLLLALKFRQWPAYAMLGLAVGAIFAAPLALLIGLTADPALLTFYGGGGGFGGALAFWVVLRPDREPLERRRGGDTR